MQAKAMWCIALIVVLISVPVYAQEAGVPEEVLPEAAETVADTGSYVIGPGDVLFVSVWKDDGLTRTVTVLPDGMIWFPLIDAVRAGGITVADFKKVMERKLARYVPDPVVSVSVEQANSMLIYIIGRVRNPGRFPVNANVTVLQALAIAAGLNEFAERDEIKIFRRQGDDLEIFHFDYDEVVKGERLEQNIVLQKGDVVVVP
jgi:polysaccharide export outer membrane protein